MTPVEWAAAAAAYAVLEYWLGKTDRVKPGSVFEVVLIGLRGAAGFLLRGKK